MENCTVLNNGLEMPWLGFGVFRVQEGDEVEQAVSDALATGYRSIDTAMKYGNETGVGKAIRESGIPREDIFLTTKLWNDDMRAKRTVAAFDESLERLGVDYVDLYLVHWPVPGFYMEAWKGMEEIYASGRAKAVGVSNFMVRNLEEVLSDCEVVPAVDQIEFHPFLVQPELMTFCKSHNIQVEAWAPLAKGQVTQNETVQKIAEKYGKTPAQVALRWAHQHGVVVIPKSIHKNRIEENFQIFDFSLEEADMETIDGMNESRRTGPDPYNFSL